MSHFVNLLVYSQSVMFLLQLAVIANAPIAINAKICNDIDVRNDPQELERLRNCSIVIGSISLVLIDHDRYHNTSEFDIVSFPELREITGYLLVFRVHGLRTLRNLFPKLAVIRGERLISHYALIIYEMAEITEIGLTSLVKIQRGYVMVRYCPLLCYVHTINWNAITQVPVGSGFGNYLEMESTSECPTSNSCPKPCDHCWNNQYCQLNETSISYTNSNVACHIECIGGCDGPTANDCHVCRNYRLFDNNTCVKECPIDKYIYSSLCVSASYCEKVNKKAILGECRDSCPPVIMERNVNITNIERCAKECPAYEIDSLSTSDLLRGCKIIKGDFFIRVQSGDANTMQILERNLGEIEEIEGIFKVYRSPVITSLSFLRNLRTIRGDSKEQNKYTFVIMSNENLQEFWNFNEKKYLELSKGNLLVHYNSKLCLNQIYDLQKILKTNSNEDFISTESNGYEQSCTYQSIETWTQILSPNSVRIAWRKANITENDKEKLLGYIIYFIEAPERNVTTVGSDTCVQYGWQSYLVQNYTINSHTNVLSTILNGLNAYTQYAYYIKTQVVLKGHEGDIFNWHNGQSNIEYFKTKEDVPSGPGVRTLSKTESSITINWFPKMQNELIESFKLDVFQQLEEPEFIDQRDYCLEPRIDLEQNVSTVENVNSSSKSQHCQIEFDNWRKYHPNLIDPDFEWRIHRKTICAKKSRPNTENVLKFVESHKFSDKYDIETFRFSRQIHDFVRSAASNVAYKKLTIDNVDENVDFGANLIDQRTFDASENKVTINNLRPYTLYVFQFFSCNQISCSPYSLYFDRTDSYQHADDVTLTVTSDANDENRIYLDFIAPNNPNGITVAFNIQKYDLATFNVTTTCVTRKEHFENNNRVTFEHLDKGRYGFRVRSISIAMIGSFTEFTFISIGEETETKWPVAAIAIIVALLLVIIAGIVFFFYGRFRGHIQIRTHSRENIVLQMHGDEDATFYRTHEVY